MGSLSRSVELTAQWDEIIAVGALYPVSLDHLHAVERSGLGDFHRIVSDVHHRLSDFIHGMVVHRRDEAIRGGGIGLGRIPWCTRTSGFVQTWPPPAPLLQCKPHLTPGGCGVLADVARIDEEFRKGWLPYFCRSGQKRDTNLEEFNEEVGGCGYHFYQRVAVPRLTGQMLADVVQREGATADSLDGWRWRELKVLPVAWYDGLARILTKVEDLGVWPDGLLDAYIAMITRTHVDAAPLGQRPLVFSRFSIVFGLLLVWVNLKTGWVNLKTGLSLGLLIRSLVLVVVVGRLRLGMLLLLTLRKFFLTFIFLLLMLSCLLTRLTGGSWIGFQVVVGCRLGSALLISNTMLMFAYVLSLLLVVMGAFPRVPFEHDV